MKTNSQILIIKTNIKAGFKAALLCLFLIFFIKTQAQDKILINENFKNISLKESLKIIETKYKYEFAYDDNLLANIKVNAKINNSKIEQSLEILLADNSLSYEIIGKTVLIYPEKKVVPVIKKKQLSLNGLVTDKQTGESLPYSSIQIKNSHNGVIANSEGFFSIFNIEKDTVTLTVSFIGYKPQEHTYTLSEKENKIKIELIPAETQISEIEVIENTEYIRLMSNTNENGTEINTKTISLMPDFGQNDPFRAMQLLPGISCSYESSSGLNIHGGTGDQNLVLYDGVTLYDVDHFYGIFSAFNTEAIKKLIFIKQDSEPSTAEEFQEL